MKKMYEKTVVMLLAFTMVFSGSVFAFAMDGSANAEQNENVTEKDANTEISASEECEDKCEAADEGASEYEDADSPDSGAVTDETSGNDDRGEVTEDALTESEAEAVAELTAVSGDIEVSYKHVKGSGTISGHYEDTFFTKDNGKYNAELARFSLLTSMAAFDLGSSGGKDKNIEDLLGDGGKLGFSGYLSDGYGVDDITDDVAAYAMAYKNIGTAEEPVIVLAVALRSSGYGGEWASNVRLSGKYSTEHSGFAGTADYIYSEIQKYIDDNQISVDKLWITGYSRGAAVANVLGKRITENPTLSEGSVIAENNLYCYTFETPTTTKATGDDKEAKGVYNVIATSDIVPQLPLYKWSYGRYGTDEYVVSSKVSIRKYNNAITGASQNFKDYSKCSSYSAQTNWANNTLINGLSSIVGGNEKSYTSNWQETFCELLGKMSGVSSADLSDLGDKVEMIGMNSYLEENGVDATNIAYHHYPEMLLAWMDEYDELEVEPQTSLTYKYLTISCKEAGKKTFSNCNITVSDAVNSGKPVAKILNGEILTNATDTAEDKLDDNYSLEVNYDDNGDIQILIPSDDKYSIEVSADEDILLSYKITEFASCVADWSIKYKNISVAGGKSLKATSPEGNVSDAEQYKPEVESLEIDDATPVTGSKLVEVTPNVEVKGTGISYGGVGYPAGVVTGIDGYADGDEVTLKAFRFNADGNSSVDYSPICWLVDGVVKSTGSSYTFTADADDNKKIQVVFNVPLSECSVSISKKTYNGKSSNPSASVYYKGVKLVEGRDYSVDYNGTKSIGKYTATVSCKTYYFILVTGRCTGSKKVTYYVAPYGTKMRSAKSGKKSFTARWYKRSTKMPKSRITGYQLQYSTSSKFSSAKKVTIKGYSKTSRKISKLKSKKTYYVRVRTYMKTKTGTCYSNWSSVKKVKTR